jgi:hypothetical protein
MSGKMLVEEDNVMSVMDGPYRSAPITLPTGPGVWSRVWRRTRRNIVAQTVVGLGSILLGFSTLLAVMAGAVWLLFPGLYHLGHWVMMRLFNYDPHDGMWSWIAGAGVIIICVFGAYLFGCLVVQSRFLGKKILTGEE